MFCKTEEIEIVPKSDFDIGNCNGANFFLQLSVAHIILNIILKLVSLIV